MDMSPSQSGDDRRVISITLGLNEANVLLQRGERRHVSGHSVKCIWHDVFSCVGRQKAAAISDNMSKTKGDDGRN